MPGGKQQFNIYLPAELIRQVKHAAVDANQSLSLFVETALQEHLARQSARQSRQQKRQ
jgi:predicted HicB family RNase H-like nuclease